MGKLQKSQTGFTVVEALVLLFTIAVICAAGWLIRNARSGKPILTTIIKTTLPPQNSATQYLALPQLGIQIPLSSTISDLGYRVAPDAPMAASLFSSTTLYRQYVAVEAACTSKTSLSEPLLESISKSTPGPNTTLLKTVVIKGVTYYLYRTGVGFCGTDESLWKPTAAQQAEITAYFDAVTAAFDAAQPIVQ